MKRKIQIHYLRCRWAVTTEFDRFVEEYEEEETVEMCRSKRLIKIQKIQAANAWIDEVFERIFIPRTCKQLGISPVIPKVQKIRSLERVLPPAMILEMRAKVPAQILRLANNESKYQSDDTTISEDNFIGNQEHYVQGRKEAFRRDARRLERRWRNF